MRTRVLLVRHGDSRHKAEGVVGGPNGDTGLTELGLAQAQALAYRLAAEAEEWGTPVSVYSSTLRRAIETAAPVAEALGVPARTDCGLCTWHVPAHGDGLPWEEYQRRYGLAGGGVFRPHQEGNETWAELVTRGSRSMIDLAVRHRGQTVIMIGHTETVNVSFHAYGLLAAYRSFDLQVDPTAVTEWFTDEDPGAGIPPARWTLTRFNHRDRI